ncbi:MAG: LysM peptidoglycan-binding domain-containing protein [Deltaproteobacteria bacterium]|nr:LysM peptidoglycan-binding domain-containing protein [Deltaproteobacteria bacterium]
MMNWKRTLVLIMGVGLFAAGCSHTGSVSKRLKRPDGLQKKGRIAQFDIPVEVNDRVLAWIDFFQGVNRERFGRYLQRSGRYVEWMRGMLKEEGLPQDLVYLALIESGFSNQAYSSAKAMGPWQFINSTGKHYGLDNNTWMDERRDPEKATRAAAQYLKKLHDEFGDWYLAMAAYNAGEGRIRGAIARSGSRNFWEITAPGTRFLKPETKDYVPKFIAAAMIAKNPHRFGFSDVEYHEPFAADEVKVEGPLDLSVAAELAACDMEEMKKLNPELSRSITPPQTYQLKIPAGMKAKFEVAFAELPPEKRVATLMCNVKRGETVSKIAKRYGISTRSIVALNNLPSAKARLKSGSVLMIPKGGLAAALSSPAAGETETTRYKVRRGDTAQKVAKKFGVSVAQLKKQNHLKGNALRVGHLLKITKSSQPASANKTLLAYNKKSKRVKQNGVEWLIRKDVGATPEEESVEVTDASANMAPQASATPPPAEIEEIDLGGATDNEQQTTDNEQKENIVDQAVRAVQEKKVLRNNATKSPAKKTTYVVKRGDSLAKIAKKNGVTVAELRQWNKLHNKKFLQAGKKLVVKSPKKAVATVSEPSPPVQNAVVILPPKGNSVPRDEELDQDFVQALPDGAPVADEN